MSTDFSIRPVGIPTPSPVAVPQSQAASNGVSTDLPASQSVTATDASAGARNDPSSASEDDVTHQAFFDREAASLVFQVVNGKNDQVVDQFPDEAVLRRRAYFHAQDLAKSSQRPHPIPTDRTA
jgi:hypothetical protein